MSLYLISVNERKSTDGEVQSHHLVAWIHQTDLRNHKTLFDYIDDLSELYGTTVIVTIVKLLIYWHYYKWTKTQ